MNSLTTSLQVPSSYKPNEMEWGILERYLDALPAHMRVVDMAAQYLNIGPNDGATEILGRLGRLGEAKRISAIELMEMACDDQLPDHVEYRPAIA